MYTLILSVISKAAMAIILKLVAQDAAEKIVTMLVVQVAEYAAKKSESRTIDEIARIISEKLR